MNLLEAEINKTMARMEQSLESVRLFKRAWVRNADTPVGYGAMGRIACECGQCPESRYDPSQPIIVCACGKMYTWDGWIVTDPLPNPREYNAETGRWQRRERA